MKTNKYKEILSSVQQTILNYDDKASALLTAVGIVFGFSLFSIQEVSSTENILKVFAYIFGATYLLTFVINIVILVLIIFPRKRKGKEKQNKIDYQFYSEDLNEHLQMGDIESFIKTECEDESIIEQIKVCTRIAHDKEKLLRLATIFIIVFGLSLVALVTCLLI